MGIRRPAVIEFAESSPSPGRSECSSGPEQVVALLRATEDGSQEGTGGASAIPDVVQHVHQRCPDRQSAVPSAVASGRPGTAAPGRDIRDRGAANRPWRRQCQPRGEWRQAGVDRVAHEPVRESPAPPDAVQRLRDRGRGARPGIQWCRGGVGRHRRLDSRPDHCALDRCAPGARLHLLRVAARGRRLDDPGAGDRRAPAGCRGLHAVHLYARHDGRLQHCLLRPGGRQQRCRRDGRHDRRTRDRCDPGQWCLDVGYHGATCRGPERADQRTGVHGLPGPDHRRQRHDRAGRVTSLGRDERRLPVPDRPARP